LQSFEKASDRPGLVARVFNQKAKSLLKDIKNGKVFRKTKDVVSVIEYQKRGLPHMHALITLEDKYKIRTTKDMDRAVSAEIPDAKIEPSLYKLVQKNMVHGPCEPNYNEHCVSMSDGRCTKRYPK